MKETKTLKHLHDWTYDYDKFKAGEFELCETAEGLYYGLKYFIEANELDKYILLERDEDGYSIRLEIE